ncbi:ALP1-like protein [Tanacetum coccineum]
MRGGFGNGIGKGNVINEGGGIGNGIGKGSELGGFQDGMRFGKGGGFSGNIRGWFGKSGVIGGGFGKSGGISGGFGKGRAVEKNKMVVIRALGMVTPYSALSLRGSGIAGVTTPQRGDNKYPTTMLEAVASHDLWIWHAFFGVAGANNDINVLDNSSLFDDLLDDNTHVAPYVLNGVMFEKGYYLADDIYPQWATFVKSFTVANDVKHAYFKKRQESAQKDVERAFGVIQGRWGIIQQPARQYHANNIR